MARINDHEDATAAGKYIAFLIRNLSSAGKLAAVLADLAGFNAEGLV